MAIDIRANDQIEWVQEALYYGLLSCDLFAALNIVLEKKFRQDKEIAVDAIWLTPRGECSGAGLLVEMPKLIVDKPNSQVNHVLGSVVVFEERNINMTPDVGTGKSAEQWAQLAVEFMRGWIIGQAGGLVVEPNAITAATDWMGHDGQQGDGIIALRGSVSQRAARPNYQRVLAPALTPAGADWTFTPNPANAGAEVYYTLDGSVPRSVPDDAGNVAARWTGAGFAVPSGALVQWMALCPGMLPSNIGAQVIE